MDINREIRLYTLDEVAGILQITRRTLYTYIKTGKLEAVKFGRLWRVSGSALNRFLNAGTTSAAPAPAHREVGGGVC